MTFTHCEMTVDLMLTTSTTRGVRPVWLTNTPLVETTMRLIPPPRLVRPRRTIEPRGLERTMNTDRKTWQKERQMKNT